MFFQTLLRGDLHACRYHAATTKRAIADLRRALNHKTEFKFSKSSDYLRDKFFECVARCPFTVRALIVRKEALHSAHLRSESDSGTPRIRYDRTTGPRAALSFKR
jgi:hypothetical protein